MQAARRRRAALGRGRGRGPVPRRARRRAAVRACPRRSSPTCRTRWSGSSSATPAPTARSRRSALRDALRHRPHAGAGAARAVGRPRARRAAPRRDANASGATPRSCDGSGAPAWPRCAPRSSPPTSAPSPASRRPGRASTATRPSGAGVDRLREVLVPLQGLPLPLEVWERDVLPRRTGAYSPAWLDQLCASGEIVWVGAGALGRRSGRVALYFRDDAPLIGPPPNSAEPPARARPRGRPRAPAGRPVLLHRPADRRRRLHAPRSSRTPSGTSCGPARRPTTRSRPCARRSSPPRRPGRSGPGPSAAAPSDHGGAAAPSPPSRAAGASPRRCSARTTIRPPAAARRPSCCSSATASSPASRCWPRASPAASAASTTRCRRWRRSASPAAATSSRASAARSSRCPAPSSGCARRRTTTPRPRSCSPPPTPPSPTAPC